MALQLLLLSILTTLVFPYSTTTTAHNAGTPENLVRSSCIHANYPDLCLRTLTSFMGQANTPNDVAKAAVTVSLARAQKVSDYLKDLSKKRNGGGGKRENGALTDCVEEMTDSVEQLKKTLSELQHLRSRTFRWQLSNVQTWVSAALTYEDTCLDGFKTVDGNINKDEIKKKINNLARITSNALYLINRLDDQSPNGRKHDP
ncbi:hypothetical protein C5167_026833 [Papaver somniferum]|uniref:pectinesterase inhibitor 3-like n=1 Tax=Papaver somniferum TaxID=3469 RepID=UPI000E6FF73A|nr:pectinesterase inhibitor 3-like [Papaver somniferum]RZC86159.1 hypothetical protein C5167_026833 [Papaver somniferum]